MFDLHGKIAVVTGAGSGIGAAIATLFAQRGARVAAVDRDGEAAQAIAAAIRAGGHTATAYRTDVADRAAVDALFSQLDASEGRIDILVNNAGIAHVGTIEQTTPEDLERIYRVNVAGVYLCARAAVPIMLRERGGVILNMASIASLVGVPDRFAYSMSKGAVLTMTMSIAIDYVKRGIRCNCICPARIHTPFVDGFVATNYPGREAEVLRRLSEYQPIGRMGRPEEVAHLALYLCSDEASFVTGQAYPIDGGVLVA
ncbi:MAG TPA: glucose 1-dehydrogenase [Vicinamibacterales bacterium]|jgi:NAD(P)-dependent dehydrogenase (short-subunit alcohol dehydrogenase family)|nr:glucose 1-dehydrogenase [Vicinamibacterales bacterium]